MRALSSCRSLVSLMLVFALALVPVACGDGNDDDVAVATDLIEGWIAGWNDNDADAIAALFTEEAVFINEGDLPSSWTGRDEIRAGVERSSGRVSDMESMGPVTMADDGTFRCSIRFRASLVDYVADNEFEVEDGLIARFVGQVKYAEPDA